MVTSPITYRTLLQQRNIRHLFVAQSISALGTWIGLIGLNVKVYDLTHSSLGVAGLFLLMAVPSLLFGLLGGVYVDHSDRKRLLVAADTVRAVLTLVLLVTHSVALLYVLIFLNAVAGVLYRTARLAMVPQLVTNQAELLSTNVLLNTSQTLTLVLGPAVGGLLVTALGVQATFALDALTFALSALLIAQIQLETAPTARRMSHGAYQQWRAGFDFVCTQRPVALIILATSAMTLGTGAVNALEIVYARTVLGVDETGYGLLLSAWGLGLLLGTLTVGWLSQRIELGRLFVAAMALLGLMFMAYAYAPTLPIAMVIGVIGGLSSGLLMNLLQTLVQTLTPVELLGRVGGFFTTVRDSMLFLSMLVAGVLTDTVGVQAIFLVAGCIILVAAALPLLIGTRTARLNWLATPHGPRSWKATKP